MKLFDKILITLSKTNASFQVCKVKDSVTLWHRTIKDGPNNYCTIAEMDANTVFLYDKDGWGRAYAEEQFSNIIDTFLNRWG